MSPMHDYREKKPKMWRVHSLGTISKGKYQHLKFATENPGKLEWFWNQLLLSDEAKCVFIGYIYQSIFETGEGEEFQ